MTRRARSVAALAAGADILVHEAIDLDFIAATGASDVQLSHLGTSHTRVDDTGAIAAAAGVRTLILSHLEPGAAGLVPDERWIAKTRHAFTGDIVRAHELQVLGH